MNFYLWKGVFLMTDFVRRYKYFFLFFSSKFWGRVPRALMHLHRPDLYIMIYNILVYHDITNYEYLNDLLVVVSQQQRLEIYIKRRKPVGFWFFLKLNFLSPKHSWNGKKRQYAIFGIFKTMSYLYLDSYQLIRFLINYPI